MELNEKTQRLIHLTLEKNKAKGLVELFKFISEINIDNLDFKSAIDTNLNKVLREEN